jgi:hypothetical protein
VDRDRRITRVLLSQTIGHLRRQLDADDAGDAEDLPEEVDPVAGSRADVEQPSSAPLLDEAPDRSGHAAHRFPAQHGADDRVLGRVVVETALDFRPRADGDPVARRAAQLRLVVAGPIGPRVIGQLDAAIVPLADSPHGTPSLMLATKPARGCRSDFRRHTGKPSRSPHSEAFLVKKALKRARRRRQHPSTSKPRADH